MIADNIVERKPKQRIRTNRKQSVIVTAEDPK